MAHRRGCGKLQGPGVSEDRILLLTLRQSRDTIRGGVPGMTVLVVEFHSIGLDGGRPGSL
jgi:hypothetical protein